MKNSNNKKKNSLIKAGFTLVETLVAIAILLLAIVGPLTIASNSLNSAYYARDQVTAYYLAQEGVEYVRYLRDTNTLSGSTFSWDYGFATTCPAATPCGYNPETNKFYTGCQLKNCPVQWDPTNKMYLQSSTNYSPTNFQRFITVTPYPAANPIEYRVVSKVIWNTGNLKSPNTFQVSEDVYNWQK